jgi:large subunit ribosomal protein L32
MAVPKKKTSKSKRRSRYATWVRKADARAHEALSIGRAVLSQNNRGFYYPTSETEESDDDE